MSLTRDQFVKALDDIFENQVVMDINKAVIALITNDTEYLDEIEGRNTLAQQRITFYLGEWDAAPTQPEKDAVVASVNSSLEG